MSEETLMKALHNIMDILEKINAWMRVADARITALEEGQIKCPKIAHTE